MAKWPIELQEALLETAQRYEKEFEQVGPHTVESKVVQMVHRRLNKPEYSVKAVLYQLAQLGFLVSRDRNAAKTGQFHAKPTTHTLHNFKVSARYPELNPMENDLLDHLLGETRGSLRAGESRECIEEWARRIALQLRTTERHAHKLMFDRKLIQLNHQYHYEWVSQPGDLPDPGMFEHVRAQTPDNSLLSTVNASRGAISKFFDARQHSTPTLMFCNYGTGLGKSYGVVDQFILELEDSRRSDHSYHRNFFFITPHKAQIDFDTKLLKRARATGIEIVAFLSFEDTRDLEFKNWLAEDDGTKITNQERYREWVKIGRKLIASDKDLYQVIEMLDDELRMLQRYLRYKKEALETGEGALSADEIQQRLKECSYSLGNVLNKLARSALMEKGYPVDLKTIFEAPPSNQSHYLRASILRHLVPFAVAMAKPTLMVATTKKFDQKTLLPHLAKKAKSDDPDAKEWKLLQRRFDCIIGGKLQKINSNADEYADCDLVDKMCYIKDDAFERDPQNHFRRAGIPFTLVLDEEHVACEVFLESSSAMLIDQNVPFSHVMSVVRRLYKQVKYKQESDPDYPLSNDKIEFINHIEAALMKECGLSNLLVLKKILDLFSDNLDYIYISGHQSEQIIGLVRSIFSFSAKRYFNESALKEVRLRSMQDGAGVQLYHTTDPEDDAISLYETYQVMLATLYASIQIPQNGNLTSLLSHTDSSHNTSLVRFIRRAHEHKDEVSNLFQRSGEQSLLDYFFVYFQPKTIFSVIPRKEIPYVDSSIEDKVFVDFGLEIIMEQPEVMLLRMLHDTQNSVICLSATTGFSKNVTGQFNRDFLTQYCKGEPANLDIHIAQPTEVELKEIQRLREARSQMRDVTSTIFDPLRPDLPGLPSGDDQDYPSDYLRVFDLYYKQLKSHVYGNTLGGYPELEFKRGLHTLLRAAYDGKHTLGLSLSHRLMNALKSHMREVMAKRVYPLATLNIIDRQAHAFEIQPFENGIKLRVILFEASTARESEPREFTQITDPNTKLVLLASYNSAGTGLNYFVRQEYLNVTGLIDTMEVDFERLVLVNQPYYSPVVSNNKESFGHRLNSLSNINRLMKYRAAKPSISLLRDFEVNVVSGEDYEFLIREHQLEQFKVIMQAIGRVERKDSLIRTELFISTDALNVAMLMFSIAKRQPENSTVLGSLSLLNDQLMRLCEQHQHKHSFSSNLDRLAFVESMQVRRTKLQRLLNSSDGIIKKILERGRQGDTDAIEFNETFRSIKSITDPNTYLTDLKACRLVMNNPYYLSLLDQLYIQCTDDLATIIVCDPEDPEEVLTDISHGNSLYDPARRVCAGRAFSDDTPISKDAKRLFTLISEIEASAFDEYIPHPDFIPHLKGNMGEYLLRRMIDQLPGLSILSPSDVQANLGLRAYELFDLYVENSKGELLCLDAKNWSSTLDKFDLSEKTMESAIRKRGTLLENGANCYPKATFIYINTRYEENPIHHQQDANQRHHIYYLNLFVRESGYKDRQRMRGNRMEQYSRESHEIRLNSTLLKLIGPPTGQGETHESI